MWISPFMRKGKPHSPRRRADSLLASAKHASCSSNWPVIPLYWMETVARYKSRCCNWALKEFKLPSRLWHIRGIDCLSTTRSASQWQAARCVLFLSSDRFPHELNIEAFLIIYCCWKGVLLGFPRSGPPTCAHAGAVMEGSPARPWGFMYKRPFN